MEENDLLTDAELAMLDEDGGVSDDAEAEVVDGIEPEEEDVLDVASGTEESTEAASGVAAVEPEADVAPLEATGRYAEVAMTDTVPAELESAMTELAKKFDDSEIDITEYLKQRAIIDRQVMTFQIEEANAQKDYNRWMDAQDFFLNDNRQYVTNSILYGALDKAVATVREDPRSKELSPIQILAAADYLVRDAFGQPQRDAAQTKEEVKQQTKQEGKPTNQKPSLPTLDRIPASAQNDTGLDPFSAIERLTGDAKEAAVAKLSPDEYQRYLAS